MTALVEPALATTNDLASRFVGRRYVQLVVVLGALMAVGPLTIDTYLPALPTLTQEMGVAASEAQLTITGLLVGLGVGQLIIGPLSDVLGRRRPLLIGLSLHAVMSVLCALAPSVELLIVTRVLQGFAGAAVSVVVMAIVRDLFTGVRAAQLLSRLILVLGVAPILAPSLGGALLRFTSWRGIFVVLAVLALMLLVLAFVALPETLPPARRAVGSIRGSLRAYGLLFRDRLFVAMVVVAGLLFATLFAYIAGAPFVMQGVYALNPQQFGLAFSSIAVGLIATSQINPVLVARFGPVRVMSAALIVATLGAALLLVQAVTGTGGLLGLMVSLLLVIGSVGLSFPNAPAIALSRHGEAAGTAAAMLGSAQFLVGGAIAPLVGALANGTAVPMAAVMLGTTSVGATLFWSVRGRLLASTEA